MASAPVIRTTGTYLTIRLTLDSISRKGDGFRLVVTAVFDSTISECPVDYTYCRNQLCISTSLFCDGVNHCVDNSDELVGCHIDKAGPDDLPLALGILVVLVVVISACVIIFIAATHCRKDSTYSQYQHHLQRTLGVPIQTSSSLMFTNQPQYHFFQPPNISPYVTPQHHALATTLPRGYSTLPLNMARQTPLRNPQTILAKANNINHDGSTNEYLMMSGFTGPQAAIPAGPTMQTNLVLPSSQSILPTTTIRYAQPGTQDR